MWLYMVLMVLTGVSYNMQKYSFAYAFGYHSADPSHTGPFFQIASEFPLLPLYYPILSSVAVLLPQSTVGLFTGIITDKVRNRVRLFGLGCIFWSSTTLIAGNTDNFYVFALMRFLFGVGVSVANAPALSLIRDYFPPDYRSTANSMYTFTLYLGISLASLSLLVIDKVGWRNDYTLYGCFGIIVASLLMTILEEPERGRYDKKKSLTEVSDDS